MGIRVSLNITVDDRSITTSALVNSGFESEMPDVCIPLKVARRLGVWRPRELYSEEATTAGGEVEVYILPVDARMRLMAEGLESEEVKCRLIVNPHVDEVLLSDYAIDELGIVAISFRRGLWRHTSESPETVRRSVEPRYW